jgi:hypothetical protein
MRDIAYLTKRGGVYYVRLDVPEDRLLEEQHDIIEQASEGTGRPTGKPFDERSWVAIVSDKTPMILASMSNNTPLPFRRFGWRSANP